MVVLVTGHHGFLGSRIVEHFAANGSAVVGAGRPEVELPSPAFDALLRATAPALVVHCAGPASVPASVIDPARDRAGSVGVLEHLLARLGSARLILVSSAAVYGQPPRLPISENDPLSPISAYGRHRAEWEHIAVESGARVAIIRVFSAYGEGLRRQVLWDICRQALAGDVALQGTGQETRDFVHARDVAAAVGHVARAAEFAGDVFNVASGVETSISDLAELLVVRLGAKSTISFSGVGRPGDPARWRADIGRLRGLGFSPGVSLEEGVAVYADWARTA